LSWAIGIGLVVVGLGGAYIQNKRASR
jgi:hypothetical protein